jgi:hypothetical protein
MPTDAVAPGRARPYRPSGLDRMVDTIDRLPVWTPLAYLAIAVLLVAAVHVAAYLDGSLAWGRVSLPLVSFGVWSAYVLGAKAHIRWLGWRVVRQMRPSLICTDSQLDDVRYRLSTQPVGPTLVVAASFVLASLPSTLFDARYVTSTGLFTSPGATVLHVGMAVVALWLTGAAGYGIVHVLRTIDHVYVHHARIDVLAPQDLFALARLAGRAALAVLAMQYIFVAANPSVLGSRAVIGQLVAWQGLAVALFLLPLWNAHRLLATAKAAMRREIGVRTERTLGELYAAVDEQALERTGPIKDALTALEAARQAVDRASTWPWDAETLRLFVSALLLPMAAWGLQQLLGRLVG